MHRHRLTPGASVARAPERAYEHAHGEGEPGRELASFSDPWRPRIVAELNGQHVKVAKLAGAFTWHHHEREDELFLTPIGAQWRLGAGAEWALSRGVSLGLDDSFIWGGTLPVSQDRGPLAGHVEGEYRDALVNMIALNLRWRP